MLLCAKIRHGCEAAIRRMRGMGTLINQYIQQYGKRLYGFCLYLCKSVHDAEDLYQETWLKVVKSIDRYDPQKEFEPWLTTICVNTYRNMLRKLSRSPFFDQFTSNEEKDDFFAQCAVIESTDYSWLHEMIDQLPEKLRLTLILYYFREMSVESTAKVLNIPNGTVKSRLSKARKMLKEALEHETDIPF